MKSLSVLLTATFFTMVYFTMVAHGQQFGLRDRNPPFQPANTPGVTISPPPENDCEFNWQKFENKCYHFLGTAVTHTFEEAIYECNKYYKGSLVKIKTPTEQQFVQGILKSSGVYNNVWLGAKFVPAGKFVSGPRQGQTPDTGQSFDSGEVKTQSGYYWIDGQPINFHNKLLSADLIRGNHTMCIAMFTHQDYFGIWTPFNCNYYFHVLCERDLASGATSLLSSSLIIMITLLVSSWMFM